jgi:peroxiredoxin
MSRLSKHRVLISVIFSCVVALAALVCIGFFAERGNGRWFTLSPVTLSVIMVAITIAPFLVTVALAIGGRRKVFSFSPLLGVGLAVLSLVIPFKLARVVFYSWAQSRHLLSQNVPALQFETLDIDGKPRNLADHQGDVVVVNVWATWCGNCRAEMPRLDKLYREHQAEGFALYGLSDEDAATQRKCLAQIPVSYPLLTYNGRVPRFYKEIGSLPATFVIDRRGLLQPVKDNSFGELEKTVATLLQESPR